MREVLTTWDSNVFQRMRESVFFAMYFHTSNSPFISLSLFLALQEQKRSDRPATATTPTPEPRTPRPTDRPTDRQAPPLAREPPPPPLPPEPTQANHPKLPPPSRVTGPPDSRRCSRSLARDDDDANANDEDRLTIEGRHARSPKMPPPSDPLSKQTNRCTTPPRRPRASRPPDSSRC